ncbi:hypothetical protein FACS189487_10480 [Campylobacterota bacterium]|nr:hypothetical protein FACS189487_10480 [Campylobacterota bacterium]
MIGCAPQARSVDLGKSCDALIYESASVSFHLAENAQAAKNARSGGVPIHLFIASIGAMTSIATFITPAGNAIALEGGSLYVLPSLTIAYYNKFAAAKEIIDRYDYLEERREILDHLLEEKHCKKSA